MKGARALTGKEITSIKKSFFGTYEVRDRSLFLIGLYTGSRISELISLNVGDVWQHGKVVVVAPCLFYPLMRQQALL